MTINDMCAVCSKEVARRDGSSWKTCYNLVFTRDSWSVANRQCESQGTTSRLAVVTSDDQNEVIRTLLQDNGISESWLAASETIHHWQWHDGMSQLLHTDTPPYTLLYTYIPG